jgi:hypothetical protein
VREEMRLPERKKAPLDSSGARNAYSESALSFFTLPTTLFVPLCIVLNNRDVLLFWPHQYCTRRHGRVRVIYHALLLPLQTRKRVVHARYNGPLLIILAKQDHTVPLAIAHASYKQQEENPGLIEIREMPNRWHSLTIEHGWREVAETALAFIAQQLKIG